MAEGGGKRLCKGVQRNAYSQKRAQDYNGRWTRTPDLHRRPELTCSLQAAIAAIAVLGVKGRRDLGGRVGNVGRAKHRVGSPFVSCHVYTNNKVCQSQQERNRREEGVVVVVVEVEVEDELSRVKDLIPGEAK